MSSYCLCLLIYYARKKCIDLEPFLQNLKSTYHEMLDTKTWLPISDWLDLCKFICEKTGKTAEDIAYELAHDIKCNLTFRIWIIGVFPIYLLKKLRILNWVITKYINNNLYFQIESSSKNFVVISVFIKDKKYYAKEMCDYHKGFIKAMLDLRGYEDIKVQEINCAVNNNYCDCCQYMFTWGGQDKKKAVTFAKLFYAKLKTEEIDDNLKECLLTEKEMDILFNKGER